MQPEKKFSERLRAYRKREEISQEELAHRLGMSRNYITQLEGGRVPSPKVIRHFELLEASPLPGPTTTREEAGKGIPSKHELIRKALYIEEHGTPDQVAMLNSMLDAALGRLGIRTTEDPPEYPGDAASREEGGDPRPPPPKRIGFSQKKTGAFVGALRPRHAT